MNSFEAAFPLPALALYVWAALPVFLAFLVPEPTLEKYLESLTPEEKGKLQKELNEKFVESKESHHLVVVRLPKEWTYLTIYPNGKYIFTVPKATPLPK